MPVQLQTTRLKTFLKIGLGRETFSCENHKSVRLILWKALQSGWALYRWEDYYIVNCKLPVGCLFNLKLKWCILTNVWLKSMLLNLIVGKKNFFFHFSLSHTQKKKATKLLSAWEDKPMKVASPSVTSSSPVDKSPLLQVFHAFG